MSWTLPSLLARSYARNLREMLELCQTLDEATLRHHVPGTNTIAHDLWHTARWADHLHSIVSEMAPSLNRRLGTQPEIWTAEELKPRWGLAGLDLGYSETGMGMDPELAVTMPLPATPELMDYARRAIKASTTTVESLTEDELREPASVAQERSEWLDAGPQSRGLVFNWILAYSRHDAEHLGAMKALANVIHYAG